jgi:hypothetical protein
MHTTTRIAVAANATDEFLNAALLLMVCPWFVDVEASRLA